MMITLREVEERIECGDTSEIIREFLEEAARSGEMFDSELVRFICNAFRNYFHSQFSPLPKSASQFSSVEQSAVSGHTIHFLASQSNRLQTKKSSIGLS
jgi:siderophore synthetase component